MVSTRTALEQIGNHLDESMGIRENDARPKLSPVASPKDVGRRPLRTFARVDLEMVAPDPAQPRSEFSEEAIQRLAQSIREKGQLHPIRVRWSDERNKWLIISGERRWRATKAAGLPTIDKPTASAPVSNDATDSNSPEPNRSSHLPTKGEMNTAQRPPRLTAPENSPRDHPKSSVMGTTNTDRAATAMTVRVDKLTDTVLPTMTHP